MNKSESIKELACALAKAQGEIENASKSSANPHFKSRYADLAEILNTVRPVLAKHGLSVAQFPTLEGSTASVETILMHSSGEWMSGTASSPMQKMDAQGVGSVTTYLRRYSLAAVCGIAQEDDDGNAASMAKPVESSSLTKQQVKELQDVLDAAGVSAKDFCAKAKIKSIAELPVARFGAAVQHYTKLIKEVAA
jgi:hypothetical protein